MRRCLEPHCLHKSILQHVYHVVWRPVCLLRLDSVGRNKLPKLELSRNPVRHIRLDTVKNVKHVIFKTYTSSSDQHPTSSFASTRDAYPKFLYRYTSMVSPYANFPKELTSCSSGQNLAGTILSLLSLNNELPRISVCSRQL
ncbi:hypothetical protein M9H77_31221 [Catharanthus roseus]|uniref:Uncharacterized protein n=1 Tax=Catharanthus roseus TaxID=4058 RepID=A0ACC0A0A8_CATRO|nr:hypothetical protein M9H77_31221 [Catharanthus roseus]